MRRRVFYLKISRNNKTYKSNRNSFLNKVSSSNNYNMNNINSRYIWKQEINHEKEWKKGRTSSRKLCHYNNERPFCVVTMNVETMRRKAVELVEAMTTRVDLCCLQDTRWKTDLKIILDKNSRYKFFGCGNDEKTSGVRILLAEKWWKKVFEVIRVSDRTTFIGMVI